MQKYTYVGDASELAWLSCAKLPPLHQIGGRCQRCEREGWVDRYSIERRFGAHEYLQNLTPKLRCLECGNKRGNVWIIGR